MFLAVSGVMIGVAASSAIYSPILKVLGANRRVMGMSITGYTNFSISVAIAIAVALLVAAVFVPQG